jgi:multicomponent Na+:H+ antiporter subunit B
VSTRTRLLVFLLGAAGLALMFARAVAELPGFGGVDHPYGRRAVAAGLARHTTNIVSSLNFDQRAFDTLGEELILMAAALGAVVVLRVAMHETEEDAGHHHYGPADVFEALRLTGYVLLPITVVIGVYIIVHGAQSPGGGFQGGVVLGSAIHLVYLAGDYPALERLRPLPVFEGVEALAAGVFVVLAIAYAGQVTAMNVAVGLEVGCASILLVAKFFEQALLVRQSS